MSSGNYTIPSGVTLLIPFDSNSTCYTTSPGYVQDSWSKPSAYYTLTMADGANIVVSGGGAISVSAKVSAKMGYAGAPTSKYGHIAMQSGSSITVNSKGNLYAWGYISGSGSVTIKSGATVYESFQVVDWRGGTASSGMLGNDNKVFPMTQYYVQNVEAPMILEAGSALTCSMIADIISVRVVTVQFLGSSGCIFNLTEGSATKRYDGSTDRLILELDTNSELTISSTEIELVPFLYSVTLSEYVLPINNNITINVNSGATLTINQDTSLLPGSQLNIAEGGTVTLGSGKRLFVYDEDEWKNEYYVYSSAYFRPVRYAHGQTYTRTAKTDIIDAQVLVNGTLNASEGYLYTTKSGANICSTANGVINLRAAESSPTLYEATQSGTSISYSSISITAAQLKHGDSTYLSTVAGNYYYHPVHKKWVKDGHSFSSAVTKPTCTEKGYTTYTCTCGYSYKGDEVAALGHNYASEVTAPTCTAQGYTTHTCTACGDSYTDSYVDAVSHNYESVTVDATCTENGSTTYTCTACGDTYTETISALGHTEVIDAAVDATCTESGLTEGSHCSVCGEIFVAQTVVDALGHIHDWKPVETTGTNGTKYVNHLCCDRCDDLLAKVDLQYRLDDYIWMNAVVTLENGVTGEITSDSGIELLDLENGTYYLVRKVVAKELTTAFTVDLAIGGIAEPFAIQLGFAAFDATLPEGHKHKALVGKMVEYGKAAKAYFDYKALVDAGESTEGIAKPSTVLPLPTDLVDELNRKDKHVNTDVNFGHYLYTQGANIMFGERLAMVVNFKMVEATDGTKTAVDVATKFGNNLVKVGLLVYKSTGDFEKDPVLSFSTEDVISYVIYGKHDATLDPSQPDFGGEEVNLVLGDRDLKNMSVSFDLTTEDYLGRFQFRPYVIYLDKNGQQQILYGRQFYYGLEDYIVRQYAESQELGQQLVNNLLVTTWDYAEAAAAAFPG